MKFSEAVRHLKGLGLAVMSPTEVRAAKAGMVVADKKAPPDGSRYQARKARPRGVVPVRILKNGALAKKLLMEIRKSRAQLRNSIPKRTQH